jgi:hypothetical protein
MPEAVTQSSEAQVETKLPEGQVQEASSTPETQVQAEESQAEVTEETSEETSEDSGESKSSADKQKTVPWFQKRINALTAQKTALAIAKLHQQKIQRQKDLAQLTRKLCA